MSAYTQSEDENCFLKCASELLLLEQSRGLSKSKSDYIYTIIKELPDNVLTITDRGVIREIVWLVVDTYNSVGRISRQELCDLSRELVLNNVLRR